MTSTTTACTLPAAVVTTLVTKRDLHRGKIAESRALGDRLAEDLMLPVLRPASRLAKVAYELALIDLLIEDTAAALSTMYHWMSDTSTNSDPVERLDSDLRRQIAREVAEGLSSVFTDAQARILMFGPRDRFYSETAVLDPAAALRRIESARPALDADTTDADLAEWARTTIIPALDEAGLL